MILFCSSWTLFVVFYVFYDILRTCYKTRCCDYFTLRCPRCIFTHVCLPNHHITCRYSYLRVSRLFFFDDFSTTNFLTFFLKKRGTSGMVTTASRSNFHRLMGIHMVLYGWSMTGLHCTALLSTLMESCMDMASSMIVLVMCWGKGTS